MILYREQDFVAEVKRLTDGKGVDVVYDGVGEATFMQSLDCLKPRGMMALFGQSSGPVKPVDPLLLSTKGSLFLTRPTLAQLRRRRDEIKWRSGDVLGWILEQETGPADRARLPAGRCRASAYAISKAARPRASWC